MKLKALADFPERANYYRWRRIGGQVATFPLYDSGFSTIAKSSSGAVADSQASSCEESFRQVSIELRRDGA